MNNAGRLTLAAAACNPFHHTARLAVDRRGAEGSGWTALALERDGGLGRLRLIGVASGTQRRSEVPDAI